MTKTGSPSSVARLAAQLPGLGLGLAVVGAASAAHLGLPWVPTLTACVVLGAIFTALPWSPRVRDVLQPGLATSARRLLRLGIVLLGLKLSLMDIAGLGWLMLGMIVLIVAATFVMTLGVGTLLRLPGDQPLLIAAGFSICGASAIGAMSGVTRSKDEEQATPIALVTLCGTLAIVVLPALAPVLGLDATQFGIWTGASVHDVGQVVATAQIAGSSALAIAIVVKLTRVALLAPLIAITALVLRRQRGDGAATGRATASGRRPPIVPLFLVGFLAAVLLRTVFPIPDAILQTAETAQFVLLGMALFALGAAIRVGTLIRTGARPLAVAAISWVSIAGLSLGAVAIATAAGVPALR